MENTILKFKQLAQEVTDFCKGLGFRQTWTDVEGTNIRVYLADGYRTRAAIFGNEAVEISLYSNKVELKIDQLSNLEKIYEDSLAEFDSFKNDKAQEVRQEMLKERDRRIKSLENELNQLKAVQ